jgi:hypothetical protein
VNETDKFFRALRALQTLRVIPALVPQGAVPMKKNYVLIDYENVQPNAMADLNQEHFCAFVFVGASQAKVNYEVASVLQSMGSRAEYIKIASNGSNALDFHIAFYIGQLAAKEPESYFHIVSKDTGFDPLIQHLKGKKIQVSRVKSILDLPLLKIAASKSNSERVKTVIARLEKNGTARPRTLKTLGSTINALFQKSLSESEVEHIIAELVKKGIVIKNQLKVTYAFPVQH